MSFLIETFFNKDNIIIEINSLDVENYEREKLLKMADELAENRFLNAVLDNLKEQDKEIFLDYLNGGTPELVAEFLHQRIEGIEEVLKEHGKALEYEILEDIKSIKGRIK